MQKLLIISLFLICYACNLFGIVIETAHFSDIKKYVQPKTLFVLDIDDTLFFAAQTMGTDVWFRHRVEELRAQMGAAGFTQALNEWEAIQHVTKVKAVEESTPAVIQELQAAQVPIIGLSTRGIALATRTVAQLHSLTIDLLKSAPSKEDLYFINEHGVLYRQGLLFTAGSHKGTALLKLLDLLSLHFDRIVFINDKASHLHEVEAVLLPPVEFIGLRYSHSDERVNRFNPQLTDIQWHHSSFGHLLSDQEAEALLNALPSSLSP